MRLRLRLPDPRPSTADQTLDIARSAVDMLERRTNQLQEAMYALREADEEAWAYLSDLWCASDDVDRLLRQKAVR